MTNFKTIQKKVQEMQEQILHKEYIGQAGGGLVQVTVNGRGYATKVFIDITLLYEKEMLEDLTIAAINDAKSKADADSQNFMANALQEIGLPPGFKLPF